MLIRMRRNWYWLLIIFGVVLGGAFLNWQTLPTGNSVTINGLTVPPVPTLHMQLVSEGETLYAQHCASCHGANLEGVPEWKTVQPDGKLLPPPHNGIHGKFRGVSRLPHGNVAQVMRLIIDPIWDGASIGIGRVRLDQKFRHGAFSSGVSCSTFIARRPHDVLSGGAAAQALPGLRLTRP